MSRDTKHDIVYVPGTQSVHTVIAVFMHGRSLTFNVVDRSPIHNSTPIYGYMHSYTCVNIHVYYKSICRVQNAWKVCDHISTYDYDVKISPGPLHA